MLNAVANLTEMKLNLTRELNTNKGEILDPHSKHFFIDINSILIYHQISQLLLILC